MEAAACPSCSYPKDKDFSFCQQCGYQRLIRPRPPSQRIQVDWKSIDARLAQLDGLLSNFAYEQQKSLLEKSFQLFLMSSSPAKDVLSATPLDVRRFLVSKDRGGKTQIHSASCENLGRLGKQHCSCPVRLSAGTVDSLIGKLCAIFSARGR